MMRALAICAASAATPALAQDQPDWAATFMTDVRACWNVTQADEPWPVVTVQFQMEPDGTPNVDSIFLIEASDATTAAADAASSAVRRAVMRCGQDGYDLAMDDYGLWDDIVVTFDPRSVTLR